jgi:hypothetical protein
VPHPTGVEDETNVDMTSRTMDYTAEVYGLYSMLQFNNIAVDFVDEDALLPTATMSTTTNNKNNNSSSSNNNNNSNSTDDSNNNKTDDDGTYSSILHNPSTRVVIVTEPSLPSECHAALNSFASRGGTVLLTRGAATRDRYGDPITGASSGGSLAPGIDDGLPEGGNVVGSVWSLPLAANGTGPTGSFEAWGSRGHAPSKVNGWSSSHLPGGSALPHSPGGSALPSGAVVTARFNDGTAATVSAAVGSAGGAVVRMLWLPGVSWIHSGWVSGASDAVLALLRNATSGSGGGGGGGGGVDGDGGGGGGGAIDGPASTNVTNCRLAGGVERGVETPLLVSPGAAAATLLNWCWGNITVTLTVQLNFTVAHVQSVGTRSSLRYSQTGSTVTVPGIHLGAVDVVTFRE